MDLSIVKEQKTPRYPPSSRLLRRLVLKRLTDLRHGRLAIHDARSTVYLGEENSDICADIYVHDARFYRSVAFDGGVGAGEAYIEGYWSSPDLVAVIRVLARNRNVLPQVESGLSRLMSLVRKGWHQLRRNTIRGSRRNIAVHYDLGNEFFATFLDKDMHYSSAWFRDPGMSLSQAQMAKMERICQRLELNSSHHVIEIGCGWGALSVYMAQTYGCRVTATTISKEQYAATCQRVEALNLSHLVHVIKQDYRELSGQYDRVVSVEMVEAVGDNYLNQYFDVLAKLLKPDGMALIQAITIEDYRFQGSLKRVDYIKRHIFPGSFIPCVSRLSEAAATTDLVLMDLFDIGSSYALTLNVWLKNFNEHLAEVKALGFDEKFIRMWTYYLCYCSGGFAERAISDVQLLMCKPLARPSQLIDRRLSIAS